MNDALRTNKWLITLTVMIVTVLEVLDMTIVNVSLPDMMGSLGANSEQITWVLTSYIVSSAILMPLTGFLVAQFGRKQLLLMNIVGFMIASALCGIATSLEEIVMFRTCQGIFGASLVPLSQYILRDTFPVEEQGKAMAIWGIGIMTAPVLGPTLGGFITENYSWRWLFYLNIPFCLASFALTTFCVSETPRIKQTIDWTGMCLLAIGVGSLQIFLDQGNTYDWFDSNFIVVLCLTCIMSLFIFILRSLRIENPVINLRLFQDTHFTASTLAIMLFIGSVLGAVTLQPMMMERLRGYPTITAGLIMAPRGIASAVAMMFSGIFMKKIPPRRLIGLGVVIASIGSYMMSEFTSTTPTSTLLYVGAFQGIGMGLFFVPLSTIAFNTLPENTVAEAAGLFSFGRSLGASIGISIMSTALTRHQQIGWQDLTRHLTINNSGLTAWLAHHGWTMQSPAAISALSHQLFILSGMQAYHYTFLASTIFSMSILFFVMLLPKKIRTDAPMVGH